MSEPKDKNAKTNAKTTASSFTARMFAPIDCTSIAVFRIVFGIILLAEVWRFYHHDFIPRFFIDVPFHFKYPFFEWVQPWPGWGMYLHVAVLGVAALLIAVGLFYRMACLVFFIGFTHLFLIERALYLNHFYLVIILSFLLIFIPANGTLSIDARLRSKCRKPLIPAWCLWILLFQISVVYFYAGLAKFHPDWLAGQPLGIWLANKSDFPLIGPYLKEPFFAYSFSYGGLIFDLSIAPLMLWKRSRIFVFIAAAGFHMTNSLIFQIGIFPWFMLAATTLYFDPDWPRVLWAKIKKLPAPELPDRGSFQSSNNKGLTQGLLLVFCIFHLLFPFRHHLYPGDAAWTGEGHNFAWRMLLVNKAPKGGFYVMIDKSSGKKTIIKVEDRLTSKQFTELRKWPDMIVAYAHVLAAEKRAEGRTHFGIHGIFQSSMNGRPYAWLVDPQVDLADEKVTLWHKRWIKSRPDDPPIKPGDPRILENKQTTESGENESD